MILALLAALGAAQAGEPPAPGNTVVVTGARVRDAATVRSFVRTVSPSAEGQLARLRAPVCPAVFGLPENYAERIVRRIRTVATNSGMETAEAGCTPNVTLIVANNSLSAVQEMQRLRPRLFNGVSNNELARLTGRSPSPVRAWSLIEIRNEDGSEAQAGADDSSRAGRDGSANEMRVRSSSIVNLSTQRVITQSVVVMEEQATVGKTLNQLADYVTVRAISGARPGGDVTHGNSILSLFDAGAQAPATLTGLDLAYLRALQQVRGNQRASTQLARMSELMAADLQLSQ